MAPNISLTTADGDNVTFFHTKETQEIYYNGFFYDITDFIERHPGGKVIKFYTASGEDATQAIQQFHFRSMNKVENMLKSFKRRAAQPHDRGMELKTIHKHDLLSEDFKKLFEELETEGYFKPSYTHICLRVLEAVGMLVLSLGIFFNCNAFYAKFLSSIAVGFAGSRFGWLQHEAGHNSLTGQPQMDKLIQILCVCVPFGASPSWWNSQHNRHHAMPQRLEHDVDLATLPFVAFNKRTVQSRTQILSFFVRFQGILYWTLDLFLVIAFWRFFLNPRHAYYKKAYYEIILGIPSLYISTYHIGLGWYFIMAYWMTFFLGINFALSHSHLDVADKPTHWIEYSLTHTANIKSSIFVDYFMGYLNFQIEHHLFPTMPQFRQKNICHRVKELATKHGLPYRVYSYTEAYWLALKNLHDVGRELTSTEYFAK